MGNYEHQQCPVPFKIESIFTKRDFYGLPSDDPQVFNGLSGIDLLFMAYEWENYGHSAKHLPSINGWSLKSNKGINKYKRHGMYVYVIELNKRDNKVYLINEDHYSDLGNVDLSVFADDESHLKEFKKDFGIKNKIKSNTYVEQTI